MFEEELSIRLRILRDNESLTQKAVAEYLGVSRSTYTYYENGKIQPSLQSIAKLSKLYGVSIDTIILG